MITAIYHPSLQALLKEVGEWRRQEEANNCLRRRFEESRHELEKVLKKAQGCLRETGDAEELLKKHTVRSHLYPSAKNNTSTCRLQLLKQCY